MTRFSTIAFASAVALAAGLPDSVAGVTLDRQCASGLNALATAILLPLAWALFR